MSMSTSTNVSARPNRTWLYVGLAFLVCWTVILRYYNPLRSRAAPRLGGGSNLGSADFAWKIQDLDGAPVEFAKYQGKPIFLNIWATWCPPCVKEMPSISRLAANPKLKDVAFVCVSVDDTTDVVKRFLEGKGWPMTVLSARGVPRVFETEGIPATFIIAPDGKIVASEVGSAEWDEPEVVDFLEKLAMRDGAKQ